MFSVIRNVGCPVVFSIGVVPMNLEYKYDTIILFEKSDLTYSIITMI